MSKHKSKATEKAHYRRKGFIVLGMHRSGTSAATRVINLLGGDIAADLMEAEHGNNDTGFWESQDIYEIHEQMLAEASGLTWDDLSPFPAEWYDSPKAAEYEQRFLEKLRQDFANSEAFVLKDPRICRLLPFWLRVFEKFETEPYFVIPIRNPIEVARSLKNRDGFHFAKSYLLWLRHNLEAERDSRGYKRSFFTYEMLLEDWRATMAKVYDDLELPLPEMSHLHDAQTEGYLSSRWRHHVITPEDVYGRPDIVDWVKTTYEVLLKAAGNDFEGMQETLDAVLEAFNTADKAFGPLVADTEMRARRNAEASTSLKTLQGEYEELRESFINKDDELSSVRQKMSVSERRLTTELERALIETEHLRNDVSALREELLSMRGSTSWRISRPVRLVGKVFGNK